MERETVNTQLLDADCQVTFGKTLATYAALVDQMFPDGQPDVGKILGHLTNVGVKVSKRRLYELNQLRACVHESWFSEELRRQEIRAYKLAAKQSPELTQQIAEQRGKTDKPRDVHFDMASRIGAVAGIKIKQGEHSPYVVDLSSIKRHDLRGATIAYALMQAVPAFGGNTSKRQLILDLARTWPEPVLTDTMEHLVVETAKRLGYTPAWALSAGSRILHEAYIEACARKDFLTLMGLLR